MKLKVYAVIDKCSKTLVSFRFGSNDSSFVRDNLPNDLYNAQTKSGLPLSDLSYRQIGYIDTETYIIEPCEHHRELDIMHCYQFKTENDLTKKESDKVDSK